MYKFILATLLLVSNTGAITKSVWQRFELNGQTQGTSFHITYYAMDSLLSRQEVEQLFTEIDSSLSLYKPYSLVNQFNAAEAGIKPDKHLAAVVLRGLEVYRATGHLFDITVYPLTQRWGFGASKIKQLPGRKEIRKLLPCIGSDKLQLQSNWLAKTKPCVQLDPNGIAQGYSVDLLATLLQQKGIENFVVEIGGELRVQGRRQPGNHPLRIGIETPGDQPWEIQTDQRSIYLEKGAVTTSGSYRKYVERKGQKLTHLFYPSTGRPVNNELVSVTVYAADAITADAYDNALMLMGLKKALAFVEQRSDICAHFIYRKKDGSLADTASSRFSQLYQPPGN